MGVIVLCIDEEDQRTLHQLAPMGAGDVDLEKMPWLVSMAHAQEARDFVRSAQAVDEVWVVSSDEISAINLAAAIKVDNASKNVYLVVFEATGSLLSCTRAAGIDGVLSYQELICRIAAEKRRRDIIWRDVGEFASSLSGLTPAVPVVDEPTAEVCKSKAQAADGLEPTAPPTETPKPATSPAEALEPATSPAEELEPAVPALEDCEPEDSAASSAAALEPAVSAAEDCKSTTSPTSGCKSPTPAADMSISATVPPATSPAASDERADQNPSAQRDETDCVQASSDMGVDVQTSSEGHFSAPAGEQVSSLRSQGQRRGNAFVMPVVSGSGGVGKSTIATLSALCAQRRGLRTLLLDCDLQFGDLHELMGIDDPVRLEDILKDPSKAGTLGLHGEVPALVASLGHLEDADAFAPMLPGLIDTLSASFDVIIINTGSNWAEHHAVLLERSSRVLFLVDQRASSIRTCRRALDLCRRCGIASGSFAYALNRCSRGALLTSVDASCALQGVHVLELRDGGYLVEELLGAGMASDLADSRNDLCVSIDRLLDEMLTVEGDPASSSLVRKQRRGRRGASMRTSRSKRRKWRTRQDRQPVSVADSYEDSGHMQAQCREEEGAAADSVMRS